VWTEEHARWQKRDLSAKRYVYCWADGIHLRETQGVHQTGSIPHIHHLGIGGSAEIAFSGQARGNL
jgi:hypothetical protein